MTVTDILTKNELENLNNNMLDLYNYQDKLNMSKLMSLKSFNDYDYYLIVCALCNYTHIEYLEKIKNKLFSTRLYYFNLTNNNKDYSHSYNDYNYDTPITKLYYCKNLFRTNKYNLYEYEINTTDKNLISNLWKWKTKDCCKYISQEKDKIIVSMGKYQLDGFIDMLDNLGIDYDIDDITKGLIHNNISKNKLVDYKQYDLPFEPYSFQIEDAHQIVKMKRALLGQEMGCGKTFISILIGESIHTPKLVICPESLRLNWKKEILQVDPTLDVKILLSSDQYETGKNWTIVGYRTASKFEKQLYEFKCMIVDEVHNCKAVNNWGKPTSKRAASVIELSKRVDYCYLLSGTPLPSHNRDLFNILKMLKSDIVDFNSTWAFKNYADRFCDPKETYFGMDYSGNSNSEELHEVLKPLMIRRLKKDVLPNLKKQRQFIPIEPNFNRFYKDIENRLYNPKFGDTYMGLAMTGRKVLSEFKLSTAIELAESMLNSDLSVVIVTNFVNTANKLKEHFKDLACEIRGGMSDQAKDNAINQFQSKEKTVCILNMQAGGLGITLTASSNLIMMDYDWVPAINIQTEDRICRPGQNETCNIYYIYCENSIFDKLFVKMISEKSENINIVIDDAENDYDLEETRETSSTYIEELKQLIESTKDQYVKK